MSSCKIVNNIIIINYNNNNYYIYRNKFNILFKKIMNGQQN